MYDPASLVSAITAAAISISKGRSSDEVELLAAILSQLGDTLATIGACEALDEPDTKD